MGFGMVGRRQHTRNVHREGMQVSSRRDGPNGLIGWGVFSPSDLGEGSLGSAIIGIFFISIF